MPCGTTPTAVDDLTVVQVSIGTAPHAVHGLASDPLRRRGFVDPFSVAVSGEATASTEVEREFRLQPSRASRECDGALLSPASRVRNITRAVRS